MRVRGTTLDSSGSPAAHRRIEVRGWIEATFLVPDADGSSKPRPQRVEVSTETVEIETGDAGTFDVELPTPTLPTDVGKLSSTPRYGAMATARGQANQILGSVRETSRSPEINLSLRLQAEFPAFKTESMVFEVDLDPGASRYFIIPQVGPGPIEVSAHTMVESKEMGDEGDKPRKILVADKDARFRLAPIAGAGKPISGLGEGRGEVKEGDSEYLHAWGVLVTNPTRAPALVHCTVTWVSRKPINVARWARNELNKRIAELLALGPHDQEEPPIRIVLGDKVSILLRDDWRSVFGEITPRDLPFFVKLKGTYLPKLEAKVNVEYGLPVIEITVALEPRGVDGQIINDAVLSFKAKNIQATLRLRLRPEAGMIVPYFEADTNVTVEVMSPVLQILTGILPGWLLQLGASEYITNRIRSVIRHDLPAALNAKKYVVGRKLADYLGEGHNHLILGLEVDEEGYVVVTYVDDEPKQLPGWAIDPIDRNIAEKIDHVVVLMMENRSFDHMLGYLSRSGERPDIEGLSVPQGELTAEFNVLEKREIVRQRKPNPRKAQDGVEFIEEEIEKVTQQVFRPFRIDRTDGDPNPGHETDDVKEQIADRAMSGFVANFAKRRYPIGQKPSPGAVMGYHDREHVSAYDAIAKHFVVCDRWFSSHPGPTFSNRFFAISGQLGPGPDGTPAEDGTGDGTPVDVRTLFHELDARRVSWRYFEHDVGFVRKIKGYTWDFGHVVGIDDEQKGFFKLARDGKLPSVTFIDPNFSTVPDIVQNNDDHPPADIARGQDLVARIYAALRSNDAQWKKTLWIITYDEHGGFYDHWIPPDAVAPPGSKSTLGVRVPALVVSPWVPAGHAEHATFDHTSIIKTILRRFAPGEARALGPRAAAAADVWHLISLDEARDTPTQLPRPASKPATKPASQAKQTEFDPTDFFRNSMRELKKIVDAQRPGAAKPPPPKVPPAVPTEPTVQQSNVPPADQQSQAGSKSTSGSAGGQPLGPTGGVKEDPMAKVVERSYQEAFGRPPAAHELAAWLASFNGATRTVQELVGSHLSWLKGPDGENEIRAMITRSYQEAFGRPSPAHDLEAWLVALRPAPRTYVDLVKAHVEWLASPVGEGERPQVVRRAYEARLHRNPSDVELASWVQKILGQKLGYTQILAEIRP